MFVRTRLLIPSLVLVLVACGATSRSTPVAPAPSPETPSPETPTPQDPPPIATCDSGAAIWADASATSLKGNDSVGNRPPGTGGHIVIVRKGGYYSIRTQTDLRTGCLTALQRAELTKLIAAVKIALRSGNLVESRRSPPCRAEAFYTYAVGVRDLGLAGAAGWTMCKTLPPTNGLMAVAGWLHNLMVSTAPPSKTTAVP